MSLSRSFDKPAKAKRKRPAPFPIRLSPEERARLEGEAGNQPLGTYIRAKLLDGEETPRRASRTPPIEYALLAQVLGMLGKSELTQSLCLMAVAAEAGRLTLEEEERAALHEVCTEVHQMRALLVHALGLKAGKAPFPTPRLRRD